jgi:hypothetical protein
MAAASCGVAALLAAWQVCGCAPDMPAWQLTGKQLPTATAA